MFIRSFKAKINQKKGWEPYIKESDLLENVSILSRKLLMNRYNSGGLEIDIEVSPFYLESEKTINMSIKLYVRQNISCCNHLKAIVCCNKKKDQQISYSLIKGSKQLLINKHLFI